MDNTEKTFVNGIKEDDSCWKVLNWYRNLYYKEENNTEHGIMARAINDLFVELKWEGYKNGDKEFWGC